MTHLKLQKLQKGDITQQHIDIFAVLDVSCAVNSCTQFFYIYLRNGTRYRHSFNGLLMGTFTGPAQQGHFVNNFRVTLSDFAKHSMTRSVARSL